MYISVDVFPPIGEIYPVGIIVRTEQQRGYVICSVQRYAAEPGADSCLEKSVKRKCADISAQNGNGKTIAGHQNSGTKGENFLKADVQKHQKGQTEDTDKREKKMPWFGQ